MVPWHVEHLSGDVGAFHDRPLADRRTATFFRCQSPTLVLGSSQAYPSVEQTAARRLGIDVVKRRSGGGGVLLWPGEFVWLDIEIPRTDPLWDDDIARAMWWVGELWREALGLPGPQVTVHKGPLVRTRWSNDVCFAGIGPGEVVDETSKLVGVSQRRTRSAARFQSMTHLRWRADVVAALVADSVEAAEIAALVGVCTDPAERIVERLTTALQFR
jgi:lipoate---protein ligase